MILIAIWTILLRLSHAYAHSKIQICYWCQ